MELIRKTGPRAPRFGLLIISRVNVYGTNICTAARRELCARSAFRRDTIVESRVGKTREAEGGGEDGGGGG